MYEYVLNNLTDLKSHKK